MDMGMKRSYVVEIEKAKEGNGDGPSVGPVYRNVLAKHGFRPLADALHSCWDVFRSSVEKYPNNPMLGQREINVDGKGARCGIYGMNCRKWVACNAHGLHCVPLYDTLGTDHPFLLNHME
ncbi:hypothetical protein L1987_25567 [Smallanthus sonchifolius]|uniref:Uncharacterized protein n=1 Tax=Smallanthus sonchifolius TaxID=185202 RepID=A0ACB9I889_9ASTR|nr:hypothetical protein L1987_25567 [Smallanthus sonchifolius]